MANRIDSVSIAVRAYPSPKKRQKPTTGRKRWRRPKAMFVFDTETRTDATQRLTFGSYRFIVGAECLEEGLFYGDDLSARERRILEQYVTEHTPDTVGDEKKELLLLSRAEFLDKLFKAAYKGRALVVGFNFPFDISRLGFDVTAARGDYSGGFSIGLWTYKDKAGREKRNGFRPRVVVKHIDNKRALIGFTARRNPDQIDLVPEGSRMGKSEKGYRFRGHFLDLRTLAFALTDRAHSLASACEAFHVEHPKLHVEKHGVITADYIYYNRRDVQATAELAFKLLEEYDRHPINLQDTKAFSPASIGKSYLRAMGINPILERHSNFQPYIGYAQTAFYGGRTSAHIRGIAVPVVYTDYLSMYPTVNSLMGLWYYVTARNIKIIDHCQDEIRQFLSTVKPEHLFEQESWQKLAAFVKVIPEGDILPTRAAYSPETHDWQVAVNHLYSDDSETGLWFSLPDVVVSVILTGRIPRIVDAFRIVPCGKLKTLKSTKLRGVIEIDPCEQDFFKNVIEERKRVSARTDLSEGDKAILSKFLKVLANGTSYGIYAEMNRHESDQQIRLRCHGIDPEPFFPRVSNPEEPGQYCFPPLASLITGAARLMLALLEWSVTELGGTYAMEDTDSMAIVATEIGGLIPCKGGPYRLPDGKEAIQALTWGQVEEISKRFKRLNPYDPEAVPGSILKIEEDNHDPKTGKQRQLFCYAISAKRYALFVRDEKGKPTLLRKNVNSKDNHWSEHGLGHLLNPTDPEGDDREWIAQIWDKIIKESEGLDSLSIPFESVPAVGRITVSSPMILEPLFTLNKNKKYSDQIKPFNFLLSCHVRPLGHPVGVDPTKFHLIAPYNSDSSDWSNLCWTDQHSGKSYRISTENYQSKKTVRVKTYGDVVGEYRFHPESKCADADGNICGRQTLGLLQRRHVRIDQIKYIGKESNSLEEVDAGTIHSEESVYTEYLDPRLDYWETKVRPALMRISLRSLVRETGLSRRTLVYARVGKRRPHMKHQLLITSKLQAIGAI